ncbi:NTP transferase domain-containing protein [Propionibacteriaceae bacterium Y1923]
MTSEPARAAFDAIVLAGGKGSRLGGVDKAALKVGGVRLLDRVLEAAAGARTTVVVGPVDAPAGVLVTREDPPGTGPAAGIAAGLAVVGEHAEWTLLLACDLPGAPLAVHQLLALVVEGSAEADAYCLARESGQPEWLFGIYRTSALLAAVEAYGDPRDRSVRGMVGPLNPVVVEPELPNAAHDLDTWSDHARWNAAIRLRTGTPPEDRTPWRPFIERVCAAVGIDPDLVDEDAVLDLTREVAHAGARAMAPVSAYILGVAVGAGGDPDYLARVVEDAATAAPVPPEADPRADAGTDPDKES